MPISAPLTGLGADDPLVQEAQTGGVLDADAVFVQLVCQTTDGGHDPNGTPDDRVRPSHAALHGTVWRLDDPRAPIPPMDYGCRCTLIHVAAPGRAGAVALRIIPQAPAAPEVTPGLPYRDWLDANAPQWPQIAEVMGKGDPATAAARGYAKARELGIGNGRDVVNMVSQTMTAPPGALSAREVAAIAAKVQSGAVGLSSLEPSTRGQVEAFIAGQA